MKSTAPKSIYIRLFRYLAVTVCLACPTLSIQAQLPDGHLTYEASGPYARLVIDGDLVRMDVAARVLVPIDGQGPTVTLVGAVHVGEPAYYAMLQSLLDAQEAVLYEGIRGGNTQPGDTISKTRSRLIHLCMAAKDYHDRQGRWPESADDLHTADAGLSTIHRRIVRTSRNDAWGHAFEFQHSEGPDGPALTLVTRGRDGEVGGDGPDKDLGSTPDKAAAVLAAYNMTRIAALLGVTTQLRHIHNDQPNWHNSDMNRAQINALRQDEKDAGAGIDASVEQIDALDVLDGTEEANQAIELMEEQAAVSPLRELIVKLLLLKRIAIAEQDKLKQQSVIIHGRNQVVVEDLKVRLSAADAPASIGVFYGRGHMEDLESQIYEQLGYRVVGELWLPAIQIDITASGISGLELKQLHEWIRANIMR